MDDNERADCRRPYHRERKPLSEQNERSPTVAKHAFEPIEDVSVPQSMAGAVVTGPPKQKKRSRPRYEFEDDDDMLAREQPQQRTTTLPPHNTWNSPFNKSSKAQPPYMTNEEFGQWQTSYLNSKDMHIAYVEKRVEEEMEQSAEYSEMLFSMHEEFTKFQWELEGTEDNARKLPVPTIHLRDPWMELSGLVLERIGHAAETLDSKDAEITALEEQLKQKNELSGQLQAKNDRIAALEAQIAEQNEEMSGQLQAKNDRIVALEAQIVEQKDRIERQSRAQNSEIEEILQLQAEAQKIDTSNVEQSSLNKKNSVCPPGLRTPSASDLQRRLEAESLCGRLTTELGSLYHDMSNLKKTYEHNTNTEGFTTTDDWGAFEEQLDKIQTRAEEALRVNSRTVYNEAMGRPTDLVIDLHQMERREISSRNDINKILNLIEQHGQQCAGAPIFGKHTVYPDFLPKKDATLRGGQGVLMGGCTAEISIRPTRVPRGTQHCYLETPTKHIMPRS